MTTRIQRCRTFLAGFRRNTSAVAFMEFALALPVFTLLALGGIELSNYVTTKMRISQIALHIADHIARVGSGDILAAKRVSQTQINDVLTGAGVQAGGLNLYTNGRVIVSDLLPDPSNSGKYTIKWQWCQGLKTHASLYGSAGNNNLTGIGPTGQKVTATTDGTIFVEVYYEYQPLISTRYSPSIQMNETAAMPVRDARDNTQIYNTEGAPTRSCSLYSAT